MYSSYLRLFWFVLIQKNAILIVYLNCKNWIINFSNFNSYTYSSVFWITTAESKQYFLLAKLFTMFHFFKENIPEELKRLFIFNKSVYSYKTRSFQIFRVSKEKASRLGLNTLSYDGAKLWYKGFDAFLPCSLFLLTTILLQANLLRSKLNIDKILNL